jgi:hypothetical protein
MKLPRRKSLHLAAATGNANESLLALLDGKWGNLRVPYPIGYYAKWMDGRIDDPLLLDRSKLQQTTETTVPAWGVILHSLPIRGVQDIKDAIKRLRVRECIRTSTVLALVPLWPVCGALLVPRHASRDVSALAFSGLILLGAHLAIRSLLFAQLRERLCVRR